MVKLQQKKVKPVTKPGEAKNKENGKKVKDESTKPLHKLSNKKAFKAKKPVPEKKLKEKITKSLEVTDANEKKQLLLKKGELGKKKGNKPNLKNKKHPKAQKNANAGSPVKDQVNNKQPQSDKKVKSPKNNKNKLFKKEKGALKKKHHKAQKSTNAGSPVKDQENNKQPQSDEMAKSPENNKKLFKKGNSVLKKSNRQMKKQPDSQIKVADLPEFNENEFKKIVSLKNVQKVVTELTKVVTDEISKMKNNQVFDDYKYILNVTQFLIPNCPKRMAKMALKHSLLSEDDSIVLFVKDLKKGMKADYEETIKHFEELLSEKGITGITKIMPFNQLKKEFNNYEMIGKLSNMYDHYLCDGSVVGHVVGFLGKQFKETRCVPYPVRLHGKNLVKEFEKAKRKTCYKQGDTGPMISIPIATNKMKPDKIAENILSAVQQLKILLPGSLANIRNMHLRINVTGTSSLPLYMSVAQPPAKVPKIVGPKETKLKELASNANDVLTKFRMTDGGKLVPLTKAEILEKRKRKQTDVKEKKSIKQAKMEQLNNENDVKEKKSIKQAKMEQLNDENESSDEESDEEEKTSNKKAEQKLKPLVAIKDIDSDDEEDSTAVAAEEGVDSESDDGEMKLVIESDDDNEDEDDNEEKSEDDDDENGNIDDNEDDEDADDDDENEDDDDASVDDDDDE